MILNNKIVDTLKITQPLLYKYLKIIILLLHKLSIL